MRRISILLAFALIVISVAVGYTLRLRIEKARNAHLAPAPRIATKYNGLALSGWRYEKDDPQTNKPIVRVDARTFQGTKDPSTFELQDLALRLYDKDASSYTYVQSARALFDEGSGQLKSDGPVHIVINVPVDQDAADPKVAEKRVRVTTSGVVYETKSGKASTDQPASFVFTQGDGQAVGVEYDPNTKVLHLKSQVALNWIGNGPPENKMHIETGDLVYKEAEQKVYLSPWSKLQRQSTTIQAQSSVVTLDDGVLQQIDSDHPVGSDIRDDRQTNYSADTMTAHFDEDGNLVQILGNQNARVVSTQPGSRTTLTGQRADLRFALETKQQNGHAVTDSDLHLVLADGHSVAESVPLPQPGVQLAETRILRSEHIELEMKPGGQDVQEIRTSSQAQLEFKPNRPDQSHRILDASHIRVLYGANSYVDTFLAWNVATHTDKPAALAKPVVGKDGKPLPPAPALTWSDQMTTKFAPNTNQVATIDQVGNFRYQEGARKAWANRAFLQQDINKITLTGGAHVIDDTGSATADQIIMNQANGDMDASGHVLSTHQPDPNQKPGTSMLDDSKPMQAQADLMQTRENNTRVHYEGHAVMWQGPNRVAAKVIDINRDDQTLLASGNVVSELVDNRQTNPPQPAADASPIYTIVRAPDLSYRDDTRVAVYSGGVSLQRDKMTVTSKELRAFLTPKTANNSGDSSLDHAFAEGNVKIFEQVTPTRTRQGTSEHCEYYTKANKVVLNGGSPQMNDSLKGTTRGRQLTYFSDDDHLIVEGEKKQLAYTQLRKH
ncbi:MAG: LPS export ABC transporter periplasmic protein LptC [Acidobacteriaceae bacterium]|nr:LPS export ABC transporter periplasmic protein LptC [Acidobacteriaceae bacterium]